MLSEERQAVGVRHGPQTSWEEQQQRKQNGQQMRESGEQPGEEGMGIRSERNAFPRRVVSGLGSRRLLLGGQAEEGGEGIWHPEQGDSGPASRWGTGIACQPLMPREAIMRPLRP